VRAEIRVDDDKTMRLSIEASSVTERATLTAFCEAHGFRQPEFAGPVEIPLAAQERVAHEITELRERSNKFERALMVEREARDAAGIRAKETLQKIAGSLGIEPHLGTISVILDEIERLRFKATGAPVQCPDPVDELVDGGRRPAQLGSSLTARGAGGAGGTGGAVTPVELADLRTALDRHIDPFQWSAEHMLPENYETAEIAVDGGRALIAELDARDARIAELETTIRLLTAGATRDDEQIAARDRAIDALTARVSELMAERETSASIAAWQNETFGPATTTLDRVRRSREVLLKAIGAALYCDLSIPRPNLSRAIRAAEELAELIDLLVTDDTDPRGGAEVADVQIVLAGIPAWHRQEQRDLVDAKMAINRARRWNLTGDGHGQHVGEAL
jgi:hypothetical protein